MQRKEKTFHINIDWSFLFWFLKFGQVRLPIKRQILPFASYKLLFQYFSQLVVVGLLLEL